MKIYIISNPQLGWDCICGAFATPELADNYLLDIYINLNSDKARMSFEEFVEAETYIIHETILIER